ncbi:MAG: radical SAM protein [Candidatus Omnitrophica bacterium]|nr:radical SAM protein [Candidatus Omnitrophota bacterium]
MNILFAVKDCFTEHIGVMMLSSVLKKAGHNVELEAATIKALKKRLALGSYGIIAYSVPTMYLEHYLKINREIKHTHNIYTVFGGSHATFVPGIIEEEGIDCICIGEGEHAMLELADALTYGRSITGIKNLWVKQDGKIYKNEVRPFIRDLDSLPFPDRLLFMNSRINKSKLQVLTSRGCPYICSYCTQNAYSQLYGPSWRNMRRRSVENVIAEIKEASAIRNPKIILFEDDLFVSDKQWLREFSLQYSRYINRPFFCYVSPRHIDEETAALLKDSGCYGVSIGVETANDDLRRRVLKRDVATDDIFRAAKLIKKACLKLETLNILGIPYGSLKDDFDTLSLNIQCRPDFAAVKLLSPYPGTEIRSRLSKENKLAEKYPDSDWQSICRFNSEREKKCIENLRALFSIAVEFPALLPLVKRLVYLSFAGAYKVIFLIWEGYASCVRLYPLGLNSVVSGLFKYLELTKYALLKPKTPEPFYREAESK